MRRFAVLFVTLCAAASAAASATWAASPGDPLQVELTARRVETDARGQETLRPAEQARPGEVVEYRASYRNAGQARISRVVATVPIPAGTEYLARSAKPAPALASLDGRTYEPLPLKRRVRTPDGREELREVPISEYRYLRWSLGAMAAGANQTVRCRVRVSPLAAAEAAARH
jgi:uncharacterized repeat protein (TIGR01451 family)